MKDASPTNWNSKVQAGGLAGATTIVLVWAVGLAGLEVPPEVASAVTTIIATFAGWITPSAARSQ